MLEIVSYNGKHMLQYTLALYSNLWQQNVTTNQSESCFSFFTREPCNKRALYIAGIFVHVFEIGLLFQIHILCSVAWNLLKLSFKYK